MESGHKSAAGGGAGGDGVLCHACGYQYPNGHPSAKQRRAHRKHCGKPASAAAEEGAGEHDGGELLPGGGGGAAEGIGASAADCGGGLAGSAPEAADAVEGGDNAEQSSGSGAGHQVTEDHLISSSNIPSEITSEASRTDDCTLTAVATQYSEKGSPIEDGDPSEPAVSSEQVEDIPTSVLPPEPEDGAKSSSQACEQEIQNSLHECETQNSTIGPLESNATGGGTSEQMGGVASQVDGIAVTEESKHVLTILFHQMGDDMNTIGKNKFSEDKSVEGVGFDLACQDHLQTEITDKHSTTAVEEASSDKNLNEKILSDETESNQQSKHVLTSSFEKIPDIEVPIESSTEKSVGTDDVLVKLGTDGSHSETPDDVKPQQQPDLTSETAGHLEISEGADGIDEQHYTISEGSIPAISSAFEPAVGGAANIAENVCSSVVTMDDSMQKNVITGTVVTSQVDPLELTTSTMAHEINMVGSTNDVEDKRQNEKGGTDLTSYRGNEMHIIENFEEKQQNKEIIVDPIPHEANAASSTDNHGENEKNEEIIADTSSCKISVVQSMTSAEEKEQIEEFIANLASEETSGTTGRGIVEEMQGEIDVKTSGEIDGACCIETAGENNATTGEVNAGTTADDVEGIIQNEEIATGPIPHGMNMTFSSINEEKMCKEEVTESLDSHENIVVHSTDNVEEKTTEETTADTASHKLSLVASTDSVAERKDGETTADPTLHETSAVHATDNVEKKNEEPILDPATTSATICSMGDVEEKKQSEETTADPSSDERNTLSGTDDAENKKQNGDTSTTGPASDKTEVAQQTTNVVEVEKTEGTASKEISTIESTDDPKGDEEIADKECSMGDVEEKKQSEETTAEPSSDERNTLSGTDNAENRKQNGDTFTIGPASDKTEVAQQTTNVVEETGKTEDTASKEISAIESTDDPKGDEEIADKEMVTDSDKSHVSLKVLLADKNVETKEKEKKASSKERVLSFRRRSSKDNVSPGKPGSPKAGTGQQDWNSPARLPVEKKPKGRKQQWVPFICCSSVQ